MPINDAIRFVNQQEDIAFEHCETCRARFICHKLSYCIEEEDGE